MSDLLTRRERAAIELRDLFISSGRYPHHDEHDLWQSCLCFVDTVLKAAAPSGTVEVLDEIGRLALLVNKAEVESCAEAGGMKPTSQHRRFTCKCGADWMTVLPDVEICQVCYHRGQPDIEDWVKGRVLCDCSSHDCNGGEHGYCGCERAKRKG